MAEKSVWKLRRIVGWIGGPGMGSGVNIDLGKGVRGHLVEGESENVVGSYHPGIHVREEVRQGVGGRDWMTKVSLSKTVHSV
jgi:hypothetical protein